MKVYKAYEKNNSYHGGYITLKYFSTYELAYAFMQERKREYPEFFEFRKENVTDTHTFIESVLIGLDYYLTYEAALARIKKEMAEDRAKDYYRFTKLPEKQSVGREVWTGQMYDYVLETIEVLP